MTWDITTPTGSDNISNGDNIIREFKTDIQAALKANDATLGDEGVFPVSTSSPKYRYRGLKGTTAQRPTAGNYGLYFNTTLNTVQRDSGSAWEDVATIIPSGTKMPFYQASAPVGWTRDVSVNDRLIRIVSAGSPGTTGGSWTAITGTTASNGAHTHTVASHSHTQGSLSASIDFAAGEGRFYFDVATGDSFTADYRVGSLSDDGATSSARSNSVEVVGNTGTTSPVTDSQGSHTHTFSGSHGPSEHAYADFMIATKD